MIELISNKILLNNNFEIREYYTESGIVKAFCCDGYIQSVMYIDKDKRTKIGLNYLNFFNLPVDLNSTGKDYLVLGGGILSYPQYFIARYNDKKMDVVEINEYCIDVAKKYFFLDETIKEYDYNNERLKIIIDDAVNFVRYCNKKYDYILIDLFNGKIPIKEIYTKESLSNIKRLLNDNGIIVVNYIISNEINYIEDLNNLIHMFKYYKVITDKMNFDFNNKIGNLIVIVSDNPIKIPNTYEFIDLVYQ